MEQERRLWGYYEVLYADAYCKIKHLYIDPGKNISYQYHVHRTEDWVIVQGQRQICIGREGAADADRRQCPNCARDSGTHTKYGRYAFDHS